MVVSLCKCLDDFNQALANRADEEECEEPKVHGPQASKDME